MKKNYDIFSEYYDEINNSFWLEYKRIFFKMIDIKILENSYALDLGCGTGSGIEQLKYLGFKNITGIDISKPMLNIAKQKFPDVKFMNLSMEIYEANNKKDLIICNFDSINYLTKKESWEKLFINVFKNLKNNGIFIFDTLTPYDHKKLWPINTRVIEKDNYTLINHGDFVKGLAKMHYSWFIYNKGKYDKFYEIHEQKSFSNTELKKIIKRHGLKVIESVDFNNGMKPTAKSIRVIYKCKKI